MKLLSAARSVLLATAIVLSLLGCDRSPSPNISIAPPPRRIAEFKPLTQLLPNRNTHIACDALGNIFYTSETERGQDGVIVVSEGGIPRATQLTSANILAAMGETVGGSGTIQDLATSPDGGIYFYFSGAKGSAIRAAVGVYYHRNGSIAIAFTHQPLARRSGMGDSIAVARGTLIPGEKRMNLLLRHSDAWAIFAFDMQTPGPGVDLKLSQPIREISIDGDPIRLSRDQYQLGPAIGPNLLLMDHATGSIWQVDPKGQTTIQTYLIGLPKDVSKPLVIKKDHLLLFIADSDPLQADVAMTIRRELPQVTYPALMEIAGNTFTAVGREDFRVPNGFPVYAMRIPQLIPAPDGSYIGYDMASGQLMRIRMLEEK